MESCITRFGAESRVPLGERSCACPPLLNYHRDLDASVYGLIRLIGGTSAKDTWRATNEIGSAREIVQDMEDTAADEGLVGLMERTSLCMSGPCPGVAAHDGDSSFVPSVLEHFTVQENNAVERLVHLKTELKDASTYDFWRILMEGMTSICGAQYGFVAKRILVDDQNSAVEMPLIGEPGSCLLGVAFYYNDGRELKNLHRDYKYLAYGAPCHNMKHDKVFLIPSGLPQFVTNNPNQFPFPTEAYLGVPLFAEGKCFAHFGMMWTTQGLDKKPLSWALVEMLLHALEDLILERLVEGQSFVRAGEANRAAKVIPQDAVTAAQSLKPYARSLSHELRTPMQGVVGMLDVMHATVQESLEGQPDAVVRKVLKTLRDNIEVVQGLWSCCSIHLPSAGLSTESQCR